jgi:hypothetical protein
MFMNNDEIFWNATLEEMKKGYKYLEEVKKFVCLGCYKTFEKGIIYNIDGVLMEAENAMVRHIAKDHGSMFSFLLEMDKKYTGLTDNQKSLLTMFGEGLSDKTIAGEVGTSVSTIRNQRFSFREKAKQAKIYLALMEILEERMKNQTDEQLIPIHRGATNVDERYAITENEKQDYIGKYFNGSRLIQFPTRQKRIIVILQHITRNFEENRKYTEKEVNEIQKAIFEDYVTLRRYLIEYGFMDRTQDCHEYWLKQ